MLRSLHLRLLHREAILIHQEVLAWAQLVCLRLQHSLDHDVVRVLRQDQLVEPILGNLLHGQGLGANWAQGASQEPRLQAVEVQHV